MTDAVPPVQPGSTASALRHWIAALALATDIDSPRVRAAVVLLAARDAGLNIDRLTRLTGFPRHFVAACARRLHDNGVWEGGETRYSWTGAEDPTFWSDVGVALGTLQRRMDERGRPVWARPGEWPASYEVVPGEERTFESGPAAAGPHRPREGWAAALAFVPGSVRYSAPHPRREAALGTPELLASGDPSGVPDLFPGASWLGEAAHDPGA